MTQGTTKLITTWWILVGLTANIWAQDPTQQGLAIAQEGNRRYRGYVDFKANLVMVLRNSRGQESRRAMRIQGLEVAGDGDKSLCLFDSPADIKGTALLTYTHKTGDDDQWLYLPALKRVKRIASSNKSGSFVGSEFAYEDIASQELEKYTYRTLRDETLDGNDCFVIERLPVDRKNSGYSRQVVWIDKAEYRTLKIEHFDRRNALLKTLTVSGYQKYTDRFWRPERMTMVNTQTGKSTELIWSDYRFGTGLKDSDFLKDNLERIR
jgi:outer membrane lipoprotein-sorting protein